MIAFKFLAAGGVGRFSNFMWPVAEWVEAPLPLIACSVGIHACRRHELLDWMDDELWEIEIAGEIQETPESLLAQRGRLVARVDSWTPEVARELTEDCAHRGHALAVRALRRAGHDEEAESLAAADGLLDIHARALVWSAARPGPASIVTAFAADAASLARGRRPDTPALLLADEVDGPKQSEAATAANLAYVTAHVAGLERAGEHAADGAYEAGFADERRRQLAWLVDRLGLD
jgi:hypothetical protein